MSRPMSTMAAATSLTVLVLALGACSSNSPVSSPSATGQESSTSASPSTMQSNETETTSSSSVPSAAAPDPEAASKVLEGQAAGVEFKKLNEFPNLDQALQGADIQIEPADCLGPGIKDIVAGALGSDKTGPVYILLSADSSTAGKYKEYAQKCTTITGTAAGVPVQQTLSLEQAPTVDGATDVVALKNDTHTTANGKEINTKAYVVAGTVNGTGVVAQTTTLTGQEPSPELAVEIFTAQVEKLNS